MKNDFRKSNERPLAGPEGLLGAIIRQALEDYLKLRGNTVKVKKEIAILSKKKYRTDVENQRLNILKEDLYWALDAKDFIFTTKYQFGQKNRLLNFLDTFGVLGTISVREIREFANKKDFPKPHAIQQVTEEEECLESLSY